MPAMNLNYAHTISSLQSNVIGKYKNTFAKFLNKAPTIVTFYNPNSDTTLDESTHDAYQQIGPDSPYHYDKITNCIVFGFPKIEDLTPEMTDFGPEISQISGQIYFPPLGHYEPYDHAYFVVDYLTGKKIFFKITQVSHDTLDNQGNWKKLDFVADLIDADLEPYVSHNYRMIQSGSGFMLIDEDNFDKINELTTLCDDLRDYYREMFWKKNLQSFVYKYDPADIGVLFYDPFMIEFLSKNKIMYGKSNKFEWVGHGVALPPMFKIDYDSSIFHAIETRNPDVGWSPVYAELIEDPLSLFTCRLEHYYSVVVRNDTGTPIHGTMADPIQRYDPAFEDALKTNKRFDPSDYRYYLNFVLCDFYEEEIIEDYITAIRRLKMVPCKEYYYTLPLVIFSLMRYIDTLYPSDEEDKASDIDNTRPSVTNRASIETLVTIDDETKHLGALADVNF